MSKLQGDIRLRIARELKDVWSLDELMNIIWTEVDAREASEGVKINSVRLNSKADPLHLTV